MSKLLLLLAFFLNPQDQPPEKCAISGTVVDALTGQPLGKVDVWVDTNGKQESKPVATGVTGAKGDFTIAGLDPGRYFLGGSRNGYLDAYYGARRPGHGSRIAISLDAGQQVKDVALKLFPYSVVAGTVHDTDGEPLSGVTVSMWTVEFAPGGRTFSQAAERDTDDMGQFRIADLEPGKYYVRAEFEKLGVPVDSFLPGVQDPDAATMVEVGLGARVTGLDIAVPRPRAFRVTVRIAAPAGFKTACWLSSGRDEYTGYADYASLVRGLRPAKGPHGEFVFEKVPAGSYTVRASARPPADCPKGLGCYGGDTVSYSASPRLDVTDRDIDDFRLNLTAGATINAHYTVEGDIKTASTSAALLFRDAGVAKFLEDQSLSTRLAPGQYVVEFTGIPSGLYLKSMRSGSADVLREGLTVSGGGAIPLEIVLSDGVGALVGAVLDSEEKPVPGATLVLVPEAALRKRSDRFYSATTDQYGRYHLEDLAPGDYKAVALDDVKPHSWLDPDLLRPLESAADAVTVQPKGHDTLNLHIRTAR
jgi:protocatechuate 3,4-dioxygenase beta subunit